MRAVRAQGDSTEILRFLRSVNLYGCFFFFLVIVRVFHRGDFSGFFLSPNGFKTSAMIAMSTTRR